MLLRMLADQASARPSKTALVCGDERLTYRDLVVRAQAYAAELRDLGAGEGRRVAIVLPNGSAWVGAFFGAVAIRSTAIGASPLLPAEDLHRLLSTAGGVAAIVTDRARATTCRAAVGPGTPLLVVDDPASGDPGLASTRTEWDASAPEAFDGPALVQFSTGSTGRAKQVVKHHRHIVAGMQLYSRAIGMTARDTVVAAVPLHHEFGFANALIASIGTGGTLVLLEPHRVDGAPAEVPFVLRVPRFLDLIERERGTIVPAPPFMFGALAETPESVRSDVSSVRLWTSAGNALPGDIFEAFRRRFGAPIRSLYGATEAGVIAVNLDPPEHVSPETVGRPIPGVEVRLLPPLDDDPGDPVRAAAGVGEVAIRSASTVEGYANQSELADGQFADGWFRPGDLGRFDAAGRLFLVGRSRLFIDSGGEKVDPSEVELALMGHPAVADVAVVGVPAPYGGEAIRAVVVPRGDVTDWELLLYLRDRLAEFKVPRFVEFRPALPRSPLGKLLRAELIAEPIAARDGAVGALRRAVAQAVDARGAQTVLERELRGQVGALLTTEAAAVSPTRPFAELGLGSLAALELRAWLETGLELTLPITVLWDYPTVRDLSRELSRRVAGADRTSAGLPGSDTHADERAALEAVERLADDEVREQLEALTRAFLDARPVTERR